MKSMITTKMRKEVKKMNCERIGQLIYELRKEKKMTQKQVADLLNITDKTISKWERGLGCPDVSLLRELASIFGISVDQLLIGELKINEQVGGKMRNVKFYVCSQCGNLMTATVQATLSCCGKTLEPLVPKKVEPEHQLMIEDADGELYITSNHEMSKKHYITFIAVVTGDTVTITKQYPEWSMQCRLEKRKRGKLYFHCNEHGLFYQLI